MAIRIFPQQHLRKRQLFGLGKNPKSVMTPVPKHGSATTGRVKWLLLDPHAQLFIKTSQAPFLNDPSKARGVFFPNESMEETPKRSMMLAPTTVPLPGQSCMQEARSAP